MRSARILAVAVIWAASLVGVAVWAQGGAPPATARVVPMSQPGEGGRVITGDSIGIRIVRSVNDQSGKVTGQLVVKGADGQWVDVVPPVVIGR